MANDSSQLACWISAQCTRGVDYVRWGTHIRYGGSAIIRVTAVCFAAYLIGYGLVGALPDFGSGVFGIGAADRSIVEQFRKEISIPADVVDAVRRLMRGELGMSLNRRLVSDEISDAIGNSFPMFISSIIIVSSAAILGAALGMRNISTTLAASRLFSFLPAYLPAYFIAGLLPLISVSAAHGSVFSLVLIAVVVAVIPAAVLLGTTQASIAASRQAPYFLTLQAHGYTDWEMLRLIGPTTINRLLPMIAGIVTSVMMVQIFVEAIFAFPGVGSSLLQAIRRTDVNLILAYILFFAVIHSTLTQFAAIIHRVRLK